MHRRPGEKQSPPGPFTEGLDATDLNAVGALPGSVGSVVDHRLAPSSLAVEVRLWHNPERALPTSMVRCQYQSGHGNASSPPGKPIAVAFKRSLANCHRLAKAGATGVWANRNGHH